MYYTPPHFFSSIYLHLFTSQMENRVDQDQLAGSQLIWINTVFKTRYNKVQHGLEIRQSLIL